MLQETFQKPILIYFNTRGQAQIIRCVLLQIQVDFEEALVGFNGQLDPKISSNYKIDIKSMPYFIHNGMKIQGTFPIVKYICNVWNRSDLLGNNIRDNAIVIQIMTKQIRCKGVVLGMLLQGLKQIYTNNLGKQEVDKLKLKMIKSPVASNLQKPITSMFKNTGQYLCGYLTILDFVYYDKVFYGINIYGSELPQMKLNKAYLDFFESTVFFQKNCEKLSKYKIIPPHLAQQFHFMLKLMWNGDPKYITPD